MHTNTHTHTHTHTHTPKRFQGIFLKFTRTHILAHLGNRKSNKKNGKIQLGVPALVLGLLSVVTNKFSKNRNIPGAGLA